MVEKFFFYELIKLNGNDGGKADIFTNLKNSSSSLGERFNGLNL